LVEEFVHAKVLPLRANKPWFEVKDDERYRGHGLKGLGIDVKQAWSRVLQKSNSLVAGVKDVYKRVAEAAEELVGALGNTENKSIRAALANRHHRWGSMNQAFDLLGLTYPDWPQVGLMEAEGDKGGAAQKRKRFEVAGEATSTSKRGGHGCGCRSTLASARVTVGKVVTLSLGTHVTAAKSESAIEPVKGPNG
jgi:hypothetical protein